MSSSDSDRDASDSEDSDVDDLIVMEMIEQNQTNLHLAASFLASYYATYVDRNVPRSVPFSGLAWVKEALNNPQECYNMFRMDASLFYKLHDLLEYIQPQDPNFHTIHSRITNDQRLWPHFKDCIGAIDGTHIEATPPKKDYIRYIGRSGKPTQNVMAVVDFDLRFTYASIGQPGSMHDTNVLYHAVEADHGIFPHPPVGKYYLVDAGYPNRDGYLAPYKGQRYHVPEWRNGPAPTNLHEEFNHQHSRLRNHVERAVGVWKMKWRILLKMPAYPIEKQKMIVAATMCLHNFIRQEDALDADFQRCDRDPDYVPIIPTRYRSRLPNASDTSTTASSSRNMNVFRDDLARAISESR